MAVAGLVVPGAVTTAAAPSAAAAPVGQGFNLNRSDLRFILRQIAIAERHASTRTPQDPCSTLLGGAPDQIPDGNQQGIELPWGLRTVDGSCNNLLPGKETLGAADTTFRRLVPARFRDADVGDPDGPFGPAGEQQTSYAQTRGTVIDATPRQISNLIVDQTSANPAAVEAAGEGTADEQGNLPIPNVAPDVGLSAPYNSMFTLFGQFFDHGLDLVTKGGGTVYMPVLPGDPLYQPGSSTNFMLLTRATNQPGPDGDLGTDDDVTEHTNTTTPFVDQNQTYTSHPSHQVFLREYELDPTTGRPVDTGRLLEGEGGGLATWGGVRSEALDKLGIVLEDTDVLDVPLLATDPYGNFLPGPDGFAQLVTDSGLVEGSEAGTPVPDDVVRTGHAFLDDIAHHALPRGDVDPADGPGPVVDLAPDEDPGVTDDGDRATYDDEMLAAHYVAGDGRANENIGLTAVHHVFHSEHNRLVADIDALVTDLETPANLEAWRSTDGPSGWDYGQRLFQAARFVTEMEYQHLVFEEFARKVQPMVNVFGEGGTGYRPVIDPSITAEFAHAVYRFGHSMLTETVARRNADGSINDVGLIEAFLNPQEFTDGGPAGGLTPDQAAGSVFRGMTRQVGSEIDEFVTEALRNNLLGLPLDLASLNIARARDAGIPTLNEARRAFFAETANSALEPYTSWADLNFGLRHPASLVNFVAAYGRHPDIVAATGTSARREAAQVVLDLAGTPAPTLSDPPTPQELESVQATQDAYDFVNSQGAWSDDAGRSTTGVDDIDLWMGGLAEKPMVSGGMLGATFNYVFETQLEDLQDGDRFYYLSRTAGLNLLTQLEGNSFAELVMRNTDVAGLPADTFSRPDFVFEVANLGTSGLILDDAATEWDESVLLTRMPDGTVRFGGGEHAVFNGTAGADSIRASEGDDTLRGNDGDDRLQGGDGNDSIVGGLGDDILTDLAGDDTIKGGDGDDAISSGQGFGGDLNQGGRGKDFIVGGNDMTESFAGPGDDFVFAGDGNDTVFGDDGDDWIEDGKGPFSLLQGDNGAPFQDDPNEAGHDVLNGDGGEQDYDAEGGDDIMMAGPGIQRSEGMLGFDWVTHKDDPRAADSDMDVNGLLPPSVETNRDRFDLVEALSGWELDDVLRGDDREAADLGTDHALTQEGIDRIAGLDGMVEAPFDGGNIIVGGAGSDEIEGRAGDDVLDGDLWLNARLSIRTDPADPSTEIGSADGMRAPYLPGSARTLQQAVFAGDVDPGDIVIVRELLDGGAADDVDVAVFTGSRDDYTVTVDGEWTTVTDDAGTDGTDRVRNVERLRFADETVDLTVVPAPPELLTATIEGTTASLTFSPGEVGAGLAVTGFAVQVLVDGQVVDAITGIPADAREAVVEGLTPGTPVTLRVVAVSPSGTSAPSAESGALLPEAPAPQPPAPQPPAPQPPAPQPPAPQPPAPQPPAPQPPAAPTILSAVVDGRTATVRFAPAASTGSAITGFEVQVINGGDVIRTVGGIPANATQVVIESLASGTTFTFRVVALGAFGRTAPSAASDPVRSAPADTTAPTVVSTRPLAGESGVRRNGNLWVRFSEPVAVEGGSGVLLRDVTARAFRSHTVRLSADGRVMVVDPDLRLSPRSRYRLVLRGTTQTGVRDLAGNPLARTRVVFRTR
ncbi:Ig-like domain-containing protein [Nocardioidaceae bacterium]|nr:Ig-like domain-containing protein [Nocardioidaceae bacterium]